MPGQLTWQFGEKLKALGVTITNSEPDDSTHKDRRLVTGEAVVDPLPQMIRPTATAITTRVMRTCLRPLSPRDLF